MSAYAITGDISVTLTFPGDMSASRESAVLIRPAWAKTACVAIGWSVLTVGDEPVGTLVFKLLGAVTDTDGAVAPSSHANPAGSAASQLVVIEMHGAPALLVSYTRTSGSGAWTGADGTGLPVVTWGA